ncbi:MAG: DUF1854 domain-containing protein [Sterolibacterium sp.]|nr:DUF1854 domain-containing protein [Sterolibacterium sp.]
MVNSPTFQLQRNAFGRLEFIDAHGQRHEAVVPVRAFPIAAPGQGIALVSPAGHELAWLQHLDALPPAQRQLIEEELAARDFMPEIQRISRVSRHTTPSTWTVTTNRGETTLLLKAEEDIRRLNQHTLLIADSHGLHFLIRDLQQLDRTSRRLLDHFL